MLHSVQAEEILEKSTHLSFLPSKGHLGPGEQADVQVCDNIETGFCSGSKHRHVAGTLESKAPCSVGEPFYPNQALSVVPCRSKLRMRRMSTWLLAESISFFKCWQSRRCCASI
eukprot:scaffold124231_cov18-Tisochrysis_lutea.AAC.1